MFSVVLRAKQAEDSRQEKGATMAVALHSVKTALDGPEPEEAQAEGLDPREWIYDLTEAEEIGPNAKPQAATGPGKANNNCTKTIKEAVTLKVRNQAFEVPVDAELVVFHKLTKTVAGSWNIPVLERRTMLASVFIREFGHITQLNVHMDGHVSITNSGIRF